MKRESSLPSAEAISEFLPGDVSMDAIRGLGVLPFPAPGGGLRVAVAEGAAGTFPNAQAAAVLAGGHPGTVETVEVPAEELSARMSEVCALRSVVDEETIRSIEGFSDIDATGREDVTADSVSAPVIKLVNRILHQASRENATDIHVEPYEKSNVVRFRIDGVLHDRLELPRDIMSPLMTRIKVMGRMDLAERMAPQDGRIGIRLGDRDVDIRVGTMPTRYGERAALRMLDRHKGLMDLKELGLSPEEYSQIVSMAARPNGMILFTGPTGSGKTTTMYAILRKIFNPSINVITVEDPVEYDMGRVTQIQVNERAGVTFASALRSILRHDPDVIMVGEMRDLETARIGVQASLTGHLVLSTLHTNDSPSAVVRLLDMGVEPYLVGGSLVGVVAQRLVRRLCPHCRKPAPGGGMEPEGCEKCMGTGYSGRIGLYEILDIDDGVRSMISGSWPGAEAIREEARRQGFRTIREKGLEKVRQGQTSLSEVLRVSGEGAVNGG